MKNTAGAAAHEENRQFGKSLDEIRADYIQRYKFAARVIHKQPVIDAGCGVGYGAAILADAGSKVHAFDVSRSAIKFARTHWSRPAITYRACDVTKARFPKVFAVAAFEFIEHVEDSPALIQKFAGAARVLVGSVPNEDVVPFDAAAHLYHYRHYTPAEITAILFENGFGNVALYSQFGKINGGENVVAGSAGRTLMFVATKTD